MLCRTLFFGGNETDSLVDYLKLDDRSLATGFDPPER